MVDENGNEALYYTDDIDEKMDKCKKVRDHFYLSRSIEEQSIIYVN